MMNKANEFTQRIIPKLGNFNFIRLNCRQGLELMTKFLASLTSKLVDTVT